MSQSLHMSRLCQQELKMRFRKPTKACLLCYREYNDDIFRSEHRTHSMHHLEVEKNINAFTIFCKILDIDPLTYTNAWNFSKEEMPFCASCTSLACRLSSLYDELGVIQQEIILNTEMIKGTILHSKDRSVRRLGPADRRVVTFREEVLHLMRKSSSKAENLNSKYDVAENDEMNHDLFGGQEGLQHVQTIKELRGVFCRNNSESRIVPVQVPSLSPNCSDVEFYKENHVVAPVHKIIKEKDFEMKPYDLQVKPVETKRNSVFVKNDAEVFEIRETKPFSVSDDEFKSDIKKQTTESVIAEFGKLLQSQLRIRQSTNHYFKQGRQLHPQQLVIKPNYLYPTILPLPPFDSANNLQENNVSFENMAKSLVGTGSPPTFYQCPSQKDSHGMTSPDSPISTSDMHNCHVCGEHYSKAYQLKAHLRLHTGEKPYKCNICAKTFRLAGNLRVHTRIHTGETPYECQFCGKKCKQKSQLNTHVLIHHKKSEQANEASRLFTN